eukprot:m.243579 g.243579  ORF g.243579 m.243579 type:complete len:373 (-) comp22550_c1_seq1:41-1159(-)
MPIKVTDYKWEETESTVHISVPLKGVKKDKADIYSNDLLVKVNFPPYLFEVDLFAAVDDEASTAVIGNSTVDFTLTKRVPSLWTRLQAEGDHAQLLQRRQDAEERKREQLKQLQEDRRAKEQDVNRLAVQKQMQIEEERRAAVEAARQSEISKAVEGLSDLDQLSVTSSPATSASTAQQPSAGAATQPVRAAGKISVKFSARAFPTPSRESYREQEEQWQEKQAEARKAVQEAKAALAGGPGNDPLWLLDKGKDFFKQGNYQAAINAFTSAVTLDANMAAAYSNRAACHLKLLDPQACAADASKALSLLLPPCEENAQSRLRAFCRRGAALAQLEDYQSAISDYIEALKIAPQSESIRADIETLRLKIAGEG